MERVRSKFWRVHLKFWGVHSKIERVHSKIKIYLFGLLEFIQVSERSLFQNLGDCIKI